MELTPQQWENVKTLFEIALEKTPAERTSFLAGAAQDSVVRREVERLLAHHVESGGFLSVWLCFSCVVIRQHPFLGPNIHPTSECDISAFIR